MIGASATHAAERPKPSADGRRVPSETTWEGLSRCFLH